MIQPNLMKLKKLGLYFMRVHFFQQFGGKIWTLMVLTYNGTRSPISALPCPGEDLSVWLEGLLSFRFLKRSTSFERTRKSGVMEQMQGISFLKKSYRSYCMAKPRARLYVIYSTELDGVLLLWPDLWIHTNK